MAKMSLFPQMERPSNGDLMDVKSRHYEESDYRPLVPTTSEGVFIPGTMIEVLRPIKRPAMNRHALFDFDGTLSLIREGWPEIMIPMMVECLEETGTNETVEELEQLVRSFVMELTGKQTIYQMIRLAEEVKKRGGTPLDPTDYKRMYHERLMARIADRREGLRTGRIKPEEMLVPGSLALLEELRRRNVELYLASGTDEVYVREEATLLGLDRYFGENIYGAIDDYKRFSKAMVIERILATHRIPGSLLLGFGDGYVEIENVKAVGGIAVAVASDEAGRSGQPDPWKRERLIGVGADIVVPDYRECQMLVAYLWGEVAGPRL
ncbi:MAG: HAD family hydrolase [Thermogutta sp.]